MLIKCVFLTFLVVGGGDVSHLPSTHLLSPQPGGDHSHVGIPQYSFSLSSLNLSLPLYTSLNFHSLGVFHYEYKKKLHSELAPEVKTKKNKDLRWLNASRVHKGQALRNSMF